MSIKRGTTTVIPKGYKAVYRGSTKVYEAGNPAPASTKVLCHFESNLNNEVSGQANITTSSSILYKTGKFDLCTYNCNGAYKVPAFTKTAQQRNTESFTIAYWYNTFGLSNYTTIAGMFRLRSSWWYWAEYDSTNQCINLGSATNTKIKTISNSYVDEGWHYITYCFNSGTAYLFYDGELITTATNLSLSSNPAQDFGIYPNTYANGIDEFLYCDECLYTSDFTPPTKPYTI